MRGRLFVFPLLFLYTLGASAQLGDKVRSLVEVNVNAPAAYDTAYVAEYRSDLLISLVTKLQSLDVALERDNSPDLTYSINARDQYGIGLDYKWLSLEALFTIPAWNDHDTALGESSSKGFGLGITRPRLWARGLWNSTQGYYLENPLRWNGNDAPVVRPDLKNRIFLLSANYALSGKKRYSQRAALFQTERQKKSAGTFVAGFSGWHTTLTGDSALLSAALLDTFQLATSFDEVQRLMLGATIGYTHTFVFWHKGFIQLGLQTGAAYTTQWIQTPDNRLRGSGVAPVAEFKGGAGYNGDRWYLALTAAYYYASAPVADELDLSMNYGHVRLALGVRFGDPGIKVLKKVGL